MANLSVQPNSNITFGIELQDDDFLVISKRSGLATQPGLGHEKDTLLNGLFAQFGNQLQNLGADRDFGLLHRLDKGTSGLLLVALRSRAYDAIRKQFETRGIRKYYWAVCSKAPKRPVGMINRPLMETASRDGFGGEKKLSKISSLGKPAATAYRVVSQSVHAALLECRPLTGRLHQVRVHLESIGCPILGDNLYAPKAVVQIAPRLCLHAHRLMFTHPVSGDTVDIRCKMPKEIKTVMNRLGVAMPDPLAPTVGEDALVSDAVPEANDA